MSNHSLPCLTRVIMSSVSDNTVSNSLDGAHKNSKCDATFEVSSDKICSVEYKLKKYAENLTSVSMTQDEHIRKYRKLYPRTFFDLCNFRLSWYMEVPPDFAKFVDDVQHDGTQGESTHRPRKWTQFVAEINKRLRHTHSLKKSTTKENTS